MGKSYKKKRLKKSVKITFYVILTIMLAFIMIYSASHMHPEKANLGDLKDVNPPVEENEQCE